MGSNPTPSASKSSEDHFTPMNASDVRERLLREVLDRRAPRLLPIVERDGPISSDERERLRSIIADELVEHGLDGNDEHNEYGRALEDVIDFIGHR